MALRIATETKKPTKKEKELESLSGAVLMAKTEYADTLKGKKKATEDIKTLTNEIKELEKQKEILVPITADLQKNKEQKEKEISNLDIEYANKKEFLEKQLPDISVHVKDFEDKKASLQSELDSVLSKRDSVITEHIAIVEKSALAQKDLDFITNKISEKLEISNKLDTEIGQKNDIISNLIATLEEAKVIKTTIDTQKENLLSINQSISESDKKLREVNTLVVSAENELQDKKDASIKIDEENAQKAKNLTLLEQRIDQKMETFKQYKDKFTVDELAKMKINTELA